MRHVRDHHAQTVLPRTAKQGRPRKPSQDLLCEIKPDPELRNMFPITRADEDHRERQLTFAIESTGSVPRLLVDRDTRILIDGYCTLEVWSALPPEVQKRVGPPRVDYVRCKTRSEMLWMRFQLRDTTFPNWNSTTAAITILRNPTLRADIKRGTSERMLAGKAAVYRKDAWQVMADEASKLGKARVSRDRLVKIDRILAEPQAKADEIISRISSGESKVHTEWKKLDDFDKDEIAKKALSMPVPTLANDADPKIDSIICGDAREVLPRIKPDTGGQAITSVPYPHPTLYERMGLPWPGYKGWLLHMGDVFRPLHTVLEPGASLYVNVAPVFSMHAEDGTYRRDTAGDLTRLLRRIGFDYMDPALHPAITPPIWYKQNADANHPMNGRSQVPAA